MVMSSPVAGAEMMHLLRARVAMCFCASAALVKRPVASSTMSTPSSFHGSLRRVLLGEDLDAVAVDGDAVGIVRDVAVVGAVHRVVLEEVRERLGVREVVDRDEVEVGDALLLGGAEDLAPDAAEAVDADANGHGFYSGAGTWAIGPRSGAPDRR